MQSQPAGPDHALVREGRGLTFSTIAESVERGSAVPGWSLLENLRCRAVHQHRDSKQLLRCLVSTVVAGATRDRGKRVR